MDALRAVVVFEAACAINELERKSRHKYKCEYVREYAREYTCALASDALLVLVLGLGFGRLHGNDSPRHSEQPSHVADHVHLIFHPCLWVAQNFLHSTNNAQHE